MNVRAEELSPGSLLAQSRVCASRNMIRLRRSKTTYLTAVIIPTVFFLGFYAALRNRLRLLGIDYEQFLTPAVVVQSMFTVGIAAGYLTADDATRGLLDRFASMPVHRLAPALGRGAADAVRALVSVLVVVIVGALFGFRLDGALGGLAFFALAAVFAMVLSIGCSAAAMRASSPEALVSAITLPYLPTLMLSTAFVPVEAFPRGLQPLVRVSPVSAVVDGLRACAAGDVASVVVAKAAAWVAALALLFLVLSVRGRKHR